MSSEELPPYVVVDASSISLALLVLGVYVCCVGQVSYWLKERVYISSALVSVLVGIAVGPYGGNIISPQKWVGNDVTAQNNLTYEFMRIVLGIQVMFTGISLPAAYLQREWKSILILIGPIMTVGYIVCAALIYAIIPGLTFLESMVIAACVVETDPVLSASIVQGKYAQRYVSKNIRDIISAEAAANDGLGFPFVYLPILLMRRGNSSVGQALGEWFGAVWLYQITLSIIIGASIGFIARKTLKEAHKRQLIDHDTFLAYGIGLAFLVLGVVGVIGSDDIFSCFICGNSLTWKDFYRVESENETFQDVIDSLINASVFIYIGTLIPWAAFNDGTIPLSAWRLVILAIVVLLLKRLPWVVAAHRQIPAIDNWKQGVFVGWYGPTAVGAIYYVMVCLRELPESRTHLREVIVPVVLFLVFASTVVHGVSIPVTKFGPKALSRTQSAFSRTSTQTGEAFQRLRSRGVKVTEISGPVSALNLNLSGPLAVSQLDDVITVRQLDGAESGEGTKVFQAAEPASGDLAGEQASGWSRDSSRSNLPGAVAAPRAIYPGTLSTASTRPSTPAGVRVEFELPGATGGGVTDTSR